MKRLITASDVLYFSDYQVDNIGELVADNLTHKYRSDGADFYYKYGKQGFDWNSGKYFVEVTCEVSSHYDAEINTNSRYGAYLDGMDGKYYTAKKDFSYNRYDTQDTMANQLVISLTDDIENQIFSAVNPEMVETCSKVTASRRVSANKKYVKAFVTQDREDAWALIDQYMEREWGHVEYNESARAILVMEMPFDGISEDGNSYSEGTCSAIINLMDFELRFNVYIPEAEGIAEEDWDHTIKYDSLADMVIKLIQPMADGEITEEKLYEMCESYYY